MSITHEFTILCNYIVAGSNGGLTLVDVFHDIQLVRIPGNLVFFLAVGFRGPVGEELTISLEAPDGTRVEQLLDATIQRELAEGSDVTKEVSGMFWQSMSHVIFRSAGDYSIVLRQGDGVIHRHLFGVGLLGAAGRAHGDQVDAAEG